MIFFVSTWWIINKLVTNYVSSKSWCLFWRSSFQISNEPKSWCLFWRSSFQISHEPKYWCIFWRSSFQIFNEPKSWCLFWRSSFQISNEPPCPFYIWFPPLDSLAQYLFAFRWMNWYYTGRFNSGGVGRGDVTLWWTSNWIVRKSL